MILDLIDRLANQAKQNDLQFLLIGGHAVTRLGHARLTLDIDFMVISGDEKKWEQLLGTYGYRSYSEGPAFKQFSGQIGWPRIDLMIVDNVTFGKLSAEAESNTGVRTPSPRHMVALKLHAATSPTRSKPAQDWEDIRNLIRIHHLDPNEQEFSALIIRYGGQSALDQLKNMCKG